MHEEVFDRSSSITFGPQHPVFPEPIQFKLKVVDEKVIGATPELGYVHRGIEKAFELNDYKLNPALSAKICGICSSPHTTSYCRAIEAVLGIDIPPRAKYLRLIINELNRLHSHVLWFGLLGDAVGFESYFMQTWNYREKVMDMLEKISGHRVYYAINAVGGVRRDISPNLMKELEALMGKLEEDFSSIADVVKDYSVKKRTQKVGVLTTKEAKVTGAVGPTLRASDVAADLRMTGYDAYGDINFKPITATSCDTYGRAVVRWMELSQSIDLIRQAISKIPAGGISVKVPPVLKAGEAVSRVEAPRGELFYYVKGNGTKNLERCKVRTPTFANVWPVVAMLSKGCEIADVAVIVLSIDPCISCTER
jgi:NADH-quinone oxidoreductase subunit D